MSGQDACVQVETRIKTISIPDYLHDIKNGKESVGGKLIVVIGGEMILLFKMPFGSLPTSKTRPFF